MCTADLLDALWRRVSVQLKQKVSNSLRALTANIPALSSTGTAGNVSFPPRVQVEPRHELRPGRRRLDGVVCSALRGLASVASSEKGENTTCWERASLNLRYARVCR